MVVLNTDDPPSSPFLTVYKKKMQVAKKKAKFAKRTPIRVPLNQLWWNDAHLIGIHRKYIYS